MTKAGGKTKVQVKADPQLDISELRESLEREYPGAEIVIEGGKPLIKPVEEPGAKPTEERRRAGQVQAPAEKRKPLLIKEIKREELPQQQSKAID